MASPKLDPEIVAHLEWIGFVRPTGLVVSAPALVRAGVILDRRDTEGQLPRTCVAERVFDPKGGPSCQRSLVVKSSSRGLTPRSGETRASTVLLFESLEKVFRVLYLLTEEAGFRLGLGRVQTMLPTGAPRSR
jgi:hypothetical protein